MSFKFSNENSRKQNNIYGNNVNNNAFNQHKDQFKSLSQNDLIMVTNHLCSKANYNLRNEYFEKLTCVHVKKSSAAEIDYDDINYKLTYRSGSKIIKPN